MLAKLRSRLTYANLMATIAIFVALGGSSYAAIEIARNSVLSKHIKNAQVKGPDLARSSVSSVKVKDRSLLAQDFASGQLPSGSNGREGLAVIETSISTTFDARIVANATLAFGQNDTNAFTASSTVWVLVGDRVWR